MDLALAFQDSQPFKLTVDQFMMLDQSGAFDNGPKVELIEGVIVCMSPMSRRHAHVAGEIYARLRDRLAEIGSALQAYPGATLHLPPHGSTDPDVTVAGGNDEDYVSVADLALAVEVSRSTLRKDLQLKRNIYALAGVSEYWVVDVDGAKVHRFADPRDGVYRAEPPVPLAGELASLTVPDLVINGSGIL